MQCLSLKYDMKIDMDSKQYVGIDLEWDYTHRTLTCSMDEYIETSLQELQHTKPKQHHNGPSKAIQPQFGQRIQFAEDDLTPTLPPDKVKYIQKVIGKLLFMARAVDNTILHTLNELARKVTKATEATLEATIYLLNYIASNPRPRIQYRASDMILCIDSDAAFQVSEGAQSRAGGYHYLSNQSGTSFNAPIEVLTTTIKPVMASAAEAEVGALFLNAQTAIPLCHCLEELGH